MNYQRYQQRDQQFRGERRELEQGREQTQFRREGQILNTLEIGREKGLVK